MTHLAYVDCSNLFIEEQKVSAVAKGMARNLEDDKLRGCDRLRLPAGPPPAYGRAPPGAWPHAGDGDYEPAVKQLVVDRFGVTVLYWVHASRELREAATAFHTLGAYIGDLALG